MCVCVYCAAIGRRVASTRLASLPRFASSYFLFFYCEESRGAINPAAGVKMPVKVHAAHVHFMVESPAPASVCVCVRMTYEWASARGEEREMEHILSLFPSFSLQKSFIFQILTAANL